MYLYYQLSGGEEAWHAAEDTPDNRATIAGKSAAFISVLSISSITDDDYDKLKYKGDLYFDIDSDDLNESISTVKNLVTRLINMDVKDFRVYLSGKKGFHLTVPAKVFSKGGQVAYLPYVYGKLAEKLEVSGLDFAVYSGGKGRLWRQENVYRKPTSTFKVQITPAQVETLTPAKYAVYVSSPAPAIPDNKVITKSLELSEMYEYCKVQVQEEEKTNSKFEFKAMPELENLAEVPECIVRLTTLGDGKTGANFNKAAMQLAGYIKSAGLAKPAIDALVSSMATNVSSGTYNSTKKRAQHIHSQLRRAKNDPRMGFSPKYLFSTIEPCGKCILCDGTLSKYDDSAKDSKKSEGDVEGSPIFESGGKYWVRQGKIDRPISTFTLTPVAYSEIYDDNTSIPERESTTVTVDYHYLGELKHYTRSIIERSWDSVSAFKKALSGIDNVSFLGGDMDLANLKHYVFSRDSEMGRITKIKSCGISSFKIQSTGKTCLVYTEPNYSINRFGEEGTHEVSKTIASPPRAFSMDVTDLDSSNESHVAIAKRLCKINDPVKMALILGWYTACHFKPHIMACEKQFPLLGIWGNAGSGKSKTASVMAYIHGCDFEGAEAIVSCGGSTPWSLRNYIATSTSTPRLIDEFNRQKIRKHYPEIVEMLKGCFNEQSSTKGVLSARSEGAEVATTVLSGPVVVMSEQFPENEPPLIQRMVTCKLSRNSRAGCEADWKYVYDNRKDMVPMAKAFVLASLKTPKKTIKYWMDYYYDKIPPERDMDARPHFSFRVVLTGLKMYELTLKASGIDVSEEVNHLVDSLTAHLFESQEAISQSKNRSVVDEILDTLAQMATTAAKNPMARNGMEYGSSYVRDNETLWIDAESVYGQYRMFSRSMGEVALIGTYRQFRDLLGEEDYFEYDEICEVLSETRKCIRLSIPLMRKKGLSVNLFEFEE